MSTLHDSFLWYGSLASAKEYLRLVGAMQQAQEQPGPLALAFQEEGEDEGRFSGYDSWLSVYDDVAVIPVTGPLGYKESFFSRVFQMMTYETLANILAAVVSDGNISKVLLDIDSPGGMAKGLSVASEAIHRTRDAGVGVVAHTSGEMLSAAYWIGSAAERVHAAKQAEVGSIGVLMVHTEVSKALEQEGVKVTVFRKGDEKALGSPYEPLTDKARASIDERLELAYTNFIEHVAQERSLSADFVRNSVASGKVFSVAEAQELGLVDGVMSYNQLVNNLIPQPVNSTFGANAMSKTPILSAAPAGLDVVTGDPADPVLAAAGLTVLAEDEEAETEVVEEGDADESTEEEDESAEEEPEAKVESSLVTMLSGLNAQLVAAQVKLEQVTSERDALLANAAGLRQIVIEQTQNLRIRLGLPAGSDLETMADSTLVATYQSVLADFKARFKPGPQARVPDKDTSLPMAAVTRLDLAVKKATSIGK